MAHVGRSGGGRSGRDPGDAVRLRPGTHGERDVLAYRPRRLARSGRGSQRARLRGGWQSVFQSPRTAVSRVAGNSGRDRAPGNVRAASRPQRRDGLPLAILGDIEGTLFDVVGGVRWDAQSGVDGGVQILDGNGVLDDAPGTFV